MSFKFAWPHFANDFIELAKEQLTEALNKGEKPANIVDFIHVTELYMGSRAPELEILEIGELAEDRFRGIFKLVYNGDGYIGLQTKVQANPLNGLKHVRQIGNKIGMLGSDMPLIVPMQLRISNFKLRGVIVLVVDKERGITLAFKNDPLEKVDVNSTFDNVQNIRRLLQRQIENQLRKLFEKDLPKMIHSLSILIIKQKERDKMASSSDSLNVFRGTVSDGNNSKKLAQFDTNSIISQSSDKELINRPHSQKWFGNNPEFDDFFSDQNADDGYTFYKALTPSDSPVKSQVGLNSVLNDIDISLKPLSRVTSPTFKTYNHFSTLRKKSTTIDSQTEYSHQSALQISMQSLPCDTASDMSQMESEPTVVVHSPRKIKLTSSETTVHLSNLFNISYTLSPRGVHLEHVLFRSQVKSDFFQQPIKNRKKKRIIKLSFGGMASSSNSSVVSGAM